MSHGSCQYQLWDLTSPQSPTWPNIEGQVSAINPHHWCVLTLGTRVVARRTTERKHPTARAHLARGARRSLAYAPAAFNQRGSQQQLARFFTSATLVKTETTRALTPCAHADGVVAPFELRWLVDVSGATPPRGGGEGDICWGGVG